MLAPIGLLVFGAVLLYAGAEAAIRGAAGFARAAGVPVFLLGALLFGIDLEGTGTVLVAAGRGHTQIAAGGAFGTVLFLFGAAFGAALLLSRDPVPSPPAEMVALPAVPLVFATVAVIDRYVSRGEGAILVVLYVLYVAVIIRFGISTPDPQVEEAAESGAGRPRWLLLAAAIAGLGLLYGGAALLVDGGVRLAARLALTPGFVGAAVVGTLASLDEVLLEVLPIRRGTPGLATGNLFGTLAAFSSGVLGLGALVQPLDLDGAASAAFLAMVLLYAVVGTVFLVRGRAGRILGAFVLAFYAAWLVITSAA